MGCYNKQQFFSCRLGRVAIKSKSRARPASNNIFIMTDGPDREKGFFLLSSFFFRLKFIAGHLGCRLFKSRSGSRMSSCPLGYIFLPVLLRQQSSEATWPTQQPFMMISIFSFCCCLPESLLFQRFYYLIEKEPFGKANRSSSSIPTNLFSLTKRRRAIILLFLLPLTFDFILLRKKEVCWSLTIQMLQKVE